MGAPRKYTQQQMLTALEQSKGMTTVAARLLGCAVDTVYAYLERYPALAAAKAQQREGMTDVAELALYKAIQSGEAWAVCFYLKTQGKARGYVERQEITGADGGAIAVEAAPARERLRAKVTELAARRALPTPPRDDDGDAA
jgi:hypothetical protein